MAGLPVTIRLLDPPLHEFLPVARGGDVGRDAAPHRASCARRTRCSGPAAAGSGSSTPRSTRCRCARSCGRRPPCASARARRRSSRSCIRSSASREELARLRELTERVAAEEPTVEYLCGTMIELPRACIRADEIAEEADFFSFGTNDLTQTTLGFSRDDAEGKFLTYYLEHGILERNPFEVLDQDGVGDLMRIAIERGRGAQAGAQDRDLRRARGRAAVGRVLPRARARLRQLLAVPGPARASRRRAGGARRTGRDRARDRR